MVNQQPNWNLENFAKFWEDIDHEISSKEKFIVYYGGDFYEEDSEAFPLEEEWDNEDEEPW